MAKLSIYHTGDYFTPEETRGSYVQMVGGGTGYRLAVLALPGGEYLVRVRRKGVEYRTGQGEDECRTGDVGALRAWVEGLADRWR